MDRDSEKKSWRKRRAYLDDFTPSANGEYVYTGLTHRYDSPIPRRKAMAVLWLLSAVLFGGLLAAGCVPAAGVGHCPYVLAPYTLSMVCAVSVIWLMGRLTAGGAELRDYVYKATVAQFKLRGWLTVILAALSFVGEIVYLSLNGAQGMTGGTVAYMILVGAAIGAGVGWILYFSNLNWSK